MSPRPGGATRRQTSAIVLAAAALAAFAAVVVAAAQGAIPGRTGTIGGCYATAGGALRLIDRDRGLRCRPTEKELLWNFRGPDGPSGTAAPTTARATFAGSASRRQLPAQLAVKSLAGGSWAVVATVTSRVGASRERIADLSCKLQQGVRVIGWATDRRVIPGGDTVIRTLTITGGALIPAVGASVNVVCSSQLAGETAEAQVMFTRVDGFS